MTTKSNVHTISNGRVIGCVYREGGGALGGVSVSCDGRRTITLFDGTYEFGDTEPGAHTIAASLKGFKSQSKRAEVGEGSTIAIDFHLPEAAGTSEIHGTVYDAETKEPIAAGGAVILILPIANRYAHLDGNGHYRLVRLVGGSYDLVTSIPGYEDARATIDVGDGEARIQDFYCKPAPLGDPPWG